MQKDDLTSKLVSTLTSLIAQRVLEPGAKLPPERELAQQFGVSRPSLRHALKVLESLGVVSQKVGSGTYVNTNGEEILERPLEFVLMIDAISHYEVLDTRLMLEPELAARAAENATAEHLRALEETLDPSLSGIAATVDADIAFHRAVYAASANRLCVRLFSALHRAMRSTMMLTSERVNWRATLAYHKPLYEAIYSRDAAEARRHMTEHLANSREVWKDITGGVRRAVALTGITPIDR
jgi:GntR family transcriptional repressor for pyruvate dehydrogenase complex